jgi:hypothetical protein
MKKIRTTRVRKSSATFLCLLNPFLEKISEQESSMLQSAAAIAQMQAGKIQRSGSSPPKSTWLWANFEHQE